jgi:hemerythrin-like domain-containing protein
MSELTKLAQVLHEEHFRSLVLICGLESRVTGEAAQRPIDPAIAEDHELLHQLIAGLDDINVHNAFEESVLFPLLKDHGDGELAELLTHEHAALAPLAQRLRSAAMATLASGRSEAGWREFCSATLELVSELMFHLQKEEMLIVQKLGTLLDGGTDRALAVRFGSRSGTGAADDEDKAA